MSKIEVNAIEPQCGTNLTVGASGDTITFPSGTTVVNNGSQTGFGRTGTVDWDTTAKTASFTAVSGNGYFVNTTSSAITLTLPASPSAGDIVSFKDYAFTFATNNLTVDGNGSPIGGVDGTINPTYDTNGTSKTFIYVDGTKGWLVTNESTDTSQESNAAYVTATGGTITCCGDYKIHTFTGPGTFTVTCAGNPGGSDTVEYLVVAGGGSGAAKGPGDGGGGGGAGGFRFASPSLAPLTFPGKPLNGPAALPVTAQGYPITVGSGGALTPAPGGPCAPSNNGNTGNPSTFSTITSAGGGRGGYHQTRPCGTGGSGGSGGGGGSGAPVSIAGGSGNTPPVSPPQGNNGGSAIFPSSPNSQGGAGGGATAVGANGSPGVAAGGAGAGLPTGFGANGESCGSFRYYAGGGAGGRRQPANGTGGVGGGGDTNSSGTANTGGGGGGGGADGSPAAGTNGGSGIVIIRYKYQ